jgi:hypothetical protein
MRSVDKTTLQRTFCPLLIPKMNHHSTKTGSGHRYGKALKKVTFSCRLSVPSRPVRQHSAAQHKALHNTAQRSAAQHKALHNTFCTAHFYRLINRLYHHQKNRFAAGRVFASILYIHYILLYPYYIIYYCYITFHTYIIVRSV